MHEIFVYDCMITIIALNLLVARILMVVPIAVLFPDVIALRFLNLCRGNSADLGAGDADKLLMHIRRSLRFLNGRGLLGRLGLLDLLSLLRDSLGPLGGRFRRLLLIGALRRAVVLRIRVGGFLALGDGSAIGSAVLIVQAVRGGVSVAYSFIVIRVLRVVSTGGVRIRADERFDRLTLNEGHRLLGHERADQRCTRQHKGQQTLHRALFHPISLLFHKLHMVKVL